MWFSTAIAIIQPDDILTPDWLLKQQVLLDTIAIIIRLEDELSSPQDLTLSLLSESTAETVESAPTLPTLAWV